MITAALLPCSSRSTNGFDLPLRIFFKVCGRLRRKLQDGRLLAFAEFVQQKDAPIRKFQRIVVCVTHSLVDLSKNRSLLAYRLLARSKVP